MNAVARLVLVAAWVVGIVLAKGFWSTLFALFFPLWAWYLLAELLIERFL